MSASRTRNLAVAMLLNALMLTTGIVLVRNTRRSRQLAVAQMDFVANVSHELRTPLTVIRGAAHNLKRGVVQERSQVEQYSGLILQHTEQLTQMVEQLLELAGARKNRAGLASEPVALTGVLKEAIAAAEHDTKAAGCVVQFDAPGSLPAIAGDAPALRRVFQNLITNAAKHGGEGKWIGVSAASVNGRNPPMIEVLVTDRGAGIPESEQAEIFKPFVRGTAAKANQVRGSGLGLTMVREIVGLHHGEVSVTSKLGHGATFYRAACLGTSDSDQMSARILLVEDEVGVALVVSDMLRAEGHQVEVANEGKEGLRRAISSKFDLLILDVMLPGMSGFEICHAARERGFDGAILMLTARGQIPDRVQGLKTGADDYLVKPFDPDELLARVGALLRRVNKEQLTPVMHIEFGDVRADFAKMEFHKAGVPVSLAAKEAELLRFLVNHRGQIVSRESILKNVWEGQQFITERTVDVHVAWLRQKLENNPQSPRHILTSRGEGYRFNR